MSTIVAKRAPGTIYPRMLALVLLSVLAGSSLAADSLDELPEPGIPASFRSSRPMSAVPSV
jgi:hypothetical protein